MSKYTETTYGLACSNCFEKVGNCKCTFNKCAICGDEFPDSETYEYRGVLSCEEHHAELIAKRDYQRQQIIDSTDKKIRSQADGEWMNGGYRTMETDTGGRPITKIKEPLEIKNYEDGKL